MSTTLAPTTDPLPKTPRLDSIDAYRGAVMFLMMAEVLHLSRVARSFPGNHAWEVLAYHQSHVEWAGCSVHDMIQPSFSFLVGVAVPFSLASRRGRGESTARLTLHAAWRSLVLIALGIFLRSIDKGRTNYTFEDTLTQIGLGYLPLFGIALGSARVRWASLLLIIVGVWLAFICYPSPSLDFASHWGKNTNVAWALDRWFLNRFPRESVFLENDGGYSTLSFVPTLATMILGLIAGAWLRGQGGHWRKFGYLMLAGGVCVGLGVGAEAAGLCPIVKRIWTPSWVLYSGGICFAVMALAYAIIDAIGWKAWTYPLRVIGRNSIAAYLLAHLIEDFTLKSLRTHLGQDIFAKLGPAYEPLVAGSALLAAYWLVLFWMDRRKLYLKV